MINARLCRKLESKCQVSIVEERKWQVSLAWTRLIRDALPQPRRTAKVSRGNAYNDVTICLRLFFVMGKHLVIFIVQCSRDIAQNYTCESAVFMMPDLAAFVHNLILYQFGDLISSEI